MVPPVLLFKNQREDERDGGVFAKEGIPPRTMVPGVSGEKDHISR